MEASKPSCMAVSASSCVIIPTSEEAIRFSTWLRRSMAFAGFWTGSKATGFWTMPASIAAWARVRSLAVVFQ